MKISLVIPVFLVLLLSEGTRAQRYDNWYFGRKAGLSFSTQGGAQPPVLLTDSEMMADEACASISDRNGNLLFYTNGVTVYNKLHEVMRNGDNLSGNISSAQVLIVPIPGNDSLYYIFTTDAVENSFQTGYRYSLVNTNRDGGKGEVTVKNSLLWPSCTERMGAARHANGTDVWLITNDNNSNTFRSWLITCSGLQANPVISVSGAVLNGFRDINTGMIKISPDGRMLCQTHFPIFDEISHIPNFAQLFDFDNSTGIISNVRTIGFPDAQYTHCEFSPSGELLYLTRPYESKLDQLETRLPNLAAILASRVTINTNSRYYDIQLAPDEKIYCAQPGQGLAAIHFPDIKGTGCHFSEQQVNFQNGSVFIGLPSYINDIVAADDPANGFTFSIVDSCAGIVQFNGYTTNGNSNWQWDFGDGGSSSLQNPVHTFNPVTAVYTVSVAISRGNTCNTVYRSKRVKPGGSAFSNARFSYVARCDSGYVRFINQTSGITSFTGSVYWDLGDGTSSTALHPVHSYAAPGTYIVKLRISNGLACLADSVVLPVEVKNFVVETIPDQTIYIGQPVFLSITEPAAGYHWSPAQWLSNSTTRSPVATPLASITYYITATNEGGCTGSDSVNIRVLQYDEIYVPSGFTPNADGKNDRLRPFFSNDFTMREFSIYNRWGMKVYTTSTRSEGWDGMIRGNPQAAGAYTWTLVLLNKSGEPVERKGVSVLIR